MIRKLLKNVQPTIESLRRRKFDRDSVFSSSFFSLVDMSSCILCWYEFPFVWPFVWPFAWPFAWPLAWPFDCASMKSNFPGSFLSSYELMITETGLWIFFIVGGPDFCDEKYIGGGTGICDVGLLSWNDSIDSISARSPFALIASCIAIRPIVPFGRSPLALVRVASGES